MNRGIPLAPLLLVTAGCAGLPKSLPPTPADDHATMTCNPNSLVSHTGGGTVERFVGQKATAQLGAEMLKASGARTLRWVPPRTAVTMDFRPDRLTVSYDDIMAIDRVGCG